MLGWTIICLLLGIEIFTFDRLLEVRAMNASVMARFYDSITRAGYRKVFPRYVTLASISPEWEPNQCSTRTHVNAILKRVLSNRPQAILVDYVLSRECPVETKQLLETVQAGCANIPIAFGYQIRYNKQFLPSVIPHAQIDPIDKDSHCVMGYINTKADYRKLPLAIRIGNQPYPSLSYAASKELRPSIAKDPVIEEQAQDAKESLFTSLFNAEDFPQISDTELLSTSPHGELREKMWQRVVVIGFETALDPARGVPYYLDQASYLEAFLDGRFLREVPEWVQLVLAGVFWIAVDSITKFWSGLAMIAVGLVAFLALNVLLIQFGGYYNDLVFVSVGGILIWALEQVHARLHHHG